MNPENALVRRRIIHAADGKSVVIEETWDTESPDCPFVFMGAKPNPYVDYKTLSRERYELYKPPTKP